MNVSETKLANPDDWEPWDLEFQSKARSVEIWDKIDPENDNEDGVATIQWLKKPKRPEISSYAKRKEPTTLTRAQSSSADTIIVEEQHDPRGKPKSAAEMTADARAAFNIDFSIYKEESKDYTDEKDAIDKLKSWVHKTVSKHYIQAACAPEDDLHNWYANLKEHVGVTDAQLKVRARDRYREAVKPLAKAPKNWNAWILQWETAMANAQGKKLAVVAEAAEWFDDLAAALKTTMPDWVNAFLISHKQKIDDNELSYRIVANSLRDKARTLDTRTGSRVAKGTFGPTFAGGEDKPDGEDTEMRDTGDRLTSGAGSRKKKSNSGKRKRTATTGESDKTCKACYGYHPLEECFYVFEDKRTEWFKERQAVRRIVDANLKMNPALMEEIKKLQRVKTESPGAVIPDN